MSLISRKELIDHAFNKEILEKIKVIRFSNGTLMFRIDWINEGINQCVWFFYKTGSSLDLINLIDNACFYYRRIKCDNNNNGYDAEVYFLAKDIIDNSETIHQQMGIGWGKGKSEIIIQVYTGQKRDFDKSIDCDLLQAIVSNTLMNKFNFLKLNKIIKDGLKKTVKIVEEEYEK